MANEHVRGGVGNLWVRQESSLGTSSATWEGMYLDEIPQFPTATRVLVENSIKGFANPMKRALPVAVEKYRESAFRIKQRIRRVVTDGDAPLMTYLFQAGGWQENATAAAVIQAGSSATSVVLDSATGIVAGECCLVEVSSGVYHPMLVAAVNANTLTPSIALSGSPTASDVVEVMDSYTPVTATGFQVPTNKTLQFRLNTLGYDDDAIGDLSVVLTGCALSDIGAIEINGVGTVPTIDYGFHVGDIAKTPNDIAADSFTDSEGFLVVTPDCQFAFQSTNAGSGIATLNSEMYEKLTFNLGLKVIPVPGTGGGGLNGVQAYTLIQEAPSCTIETWYRGDANFEKKWWTEMEDDNSRQYIHWIQPTRNLDHPAFGIWMPSCHLKAGSEPTFDATGDLIKCTATFEATLGAWGDEEGISAVASSPIVIAISNEEAA